MQTLTTPHPRQKQYSAILEAQQILKELQQRDKGQVEDLQIRAEKALLQFPKFNPAGEPLFFPNPQSNPQFNLNRQ